jgi:PLP dependent protein
MMMSIEERIQANYEAIQDRVARAAASAGERAEGICIVVVSKLQTAEVVRAAYRVGIRSFGENYPQEAAPKIATLGDLKEITWHMIGQVQSRKSKVIAQSFQMIHSIDNLPHAQKLDAALEHEKKHMTALLEVNLAGEESKAGWKVQTPAEWEAMLPEIMAMLRLPNLKIKGLMTMPPLANLPELSRPYFSRLREMQHYLNSQISSRPFSMLSMGTSADFEVAIQEGATIVRIGQAILGPRLTNSSL